MSIQIQVSVSEQEYIEVNRQMMLHTTWNRRVGYSLLWYGYPATALLTIGCGLWLWIGDGSSSQLVVDSLVFAVLLGLARFRLPRMYRKLYREQLPRLTGTTTLDASGVSYVNAGRDVEGRYTWTAMRTWLETPEMFLLLMTSVNFFRIPKRDLSTLEQDQVRQWIVDAGVMRAK